MDNRIIVALVGALAMIIVAIITHPPEQSHTTGDISVSSSPSGASIYLDGSYQGVSPMTIKGIQEGSYTIILKDIGYQDWSQTIKVRPGDTIFVSPLLIVTTTATATQTPKPELIVSPDPISYDLDTMNAGTRASRSFSISNAGSGILTWNVNTDKSWITTIPKSGINSGTVTININTAGLSPGSNSGTITVASNDGTKTGIISLTINPLGSQITDFVGSWFNTDPNTRGIPKIEISSGGNNLLNVHGYGACTPTYCDWGIVTVPFQGNPVTTIYKFSFKIDTLTITLMSDGKLHVNSKNVFTDGSNRDYTEDDYFIK